MKYTLYHYRGIQGAWFNHGAITFAATKREIPKVEKLVRRHLQESSDDVYVWLLSDSAPKQVGCGPCGSFPLKSDRRTLGRLQNSYCRAHSFLQKHTR